MIRAARLPDLKSLYDIERHSFMTDGMTPPRFRYCMTGARSDFLVDARADGVVAGYVIVLYHRGRPDMGRVYSIATHPDFRGAGAGTKLLRAAERAAKKRGMKRMVLEVRRNAKKTVDWYIKHGYAVQRVEPSYYEDGMDALKMCKPL